MSDFDLIITSRQRDIGGFMVRRLLPYVQRRMVGPYIFFDHMGPSHFPPGKGMDVRPHPHINLATVTYLFAGAIHHRDSLGSNQLIEPGAINWMTAGHGIVHSERTPADLRATGGPTHGLQLWVALPEEHEEIDPSFDHYPASSVPYFEIEGGMCRLMVGSELGHKSPVKVLSPMFYLEVNLRPGAAFQFPLKERDGAVYVLEGELTSSRGQILKSYEMGVFKTSPDVTLKSTTSSKFVLIGGEPLGERHLDWNFVSSSKERLAEVREEWSSFGPRKESSRFKPIPGDDKEYIPL